MGLFKKMFGTYSDRQIKKLKRVADAIAETTNNLYVVNIARRKNTMDRSAPVEEYYAFSRKDIIAIGKTLEETAVRTSDLAMRKYCKDVITVFHGKNVRREQLENITSALELLGICAEVFLVPLEKASSELILSFE